MIITVLNCLRQIYTYIYPTIQDSFNFMMPVTNRVTDWCPAVTSLFLLTIIGRKEYITSPWHPDLQFIYKTYQKTNTKASVLKVFIYLVNSSFIPLQIRYAQHHADAGDVIPKKNDKSSNPQAVSR